MKKALCGLLAGALLVSSAPAFAEDGPAYLPRVSPVTITPSVRDAVKRSVAASLAQAEARESDAAAAFLPRTLPRGNGGARKQVAGGGGGGHAMMLVGLVTTVASVAGGYLIYKQVTKDTKNAASNSQ